MNLSDGYFETHNRGKNEDRMSMDDTGIVTIRQVDPLYLNRKMETY